MPFVYAGIAAVVIAIVIYCVPPIPYFLARAAGIRDLTASMFIVMRLRKVPPGAIVMPLIIATKAGVEITAIQLMTHYVAGGDVESVVLKLIAANKSGKTTTFVEAAAADLAKNSKLRGKPFDFKRISPINAYISAVAAGVSVTPGEIIGMMRSGIAPGEIVMPTIVLTKAGVNVTVSDVLAVKKAGADTQKVTLALVTAKRSGISLTVDEAVGMSTSGQDPLAYVQRQIAPEVGATTHAVGTLTEDCSGES